MINCTGCGWDKNCVSSLEKVSMKIKKSKNSIIYALVVGAIATGVGIGLIFWYLSRTNATIVSYFFCGMILFCGLVAFVGAGLKGLKVARQKAILKLGKSTVAKYLSHDCKIYNKNGSLYFIEFEYVDENGNTVRKKSGNDFSWKDILTLKCASTFQIAYYKNHCVLTSDLDVLAEKFAADMLKLQEIYLNAYDGVDQMIERDKQVGHNRPRDKVNKHKKKKDEPENPQDIPQAKDDEEIDKREAGSGEFKNKKIK